MDIFRRSLMVFLMSLAVPGMAHAKSSVTLTDIAGREVSVNVPVETMILGEGRFLPTIAILDRANPLQRIVAMMGEFARFDPATYAQYQKHFPKIDDIPLLGVNGAASFSSEQAINAKPDVAIFGLGSGHGPGERNKEILDRLKAAGVPVVIVDFRNEPLVNTQKSMQLLGTLMGREKEADEFLAFYRAGLAVVHDRLEGVREKPSVFMEIRVGLRGQCCESIGTEMMGRFIDWAGGRNIVADKIPGSHGMVNGEYLLVAQPDYYIATAVGNFPLNEIDAKRVVLGAGAPEVVAAESLERAVRRPVVSELSAVKAGRAYAIWHHFYNTPMNVAAVQMMAKWLHPRLFTDVDPYATLTAYFERFQSVPLDGVYWTGLRRNE